MPSSWLTMAALAWGSSLGAASAQAMDMSTRQSTASSPQIMAKARTQGIHVMLAAIGGENNAAVAFHQRLGFTKTGHLPQVGRNMGRWHDLILMSKTLTAP